MTQTVTRYRGTRRRPRLRRGARGRPDAASRRAAAVRGGEEAVTATLAMDESVPPSELAELVVFLATRPRAPPDRRDARRQRRDLRPMKFGIWHDFRDPPRWHPLRPALPREPRSDRVAEELGYESVWVSEHHVTDEGYLPSVFPLLAAIAARTTTIRLGSAILLGPFHHPIRFAEDVAFVDQLSGGRVEVGLGLGYRRASSRARRPDRRARDTDGGARRGRTPRLGRRTVLHHRPHWSLGRGRDAAAVPAAGPPFWIGGSAPRQPGARGGSAAPSCPTPRRRRDYRLPRRWPRPGTTRLSSHSDEPDDLRPATLGRGRGAPPLPVQPLPRVGRRRDGPRPRARRRAAARPLSDRLAREVAAGVGRSSSAPASTALLLGAPARLGIERAPLARALRRSTFSRTRVSSGCLQLVCEHVRAAQPVAVAWPLCSMRIGVSRAMKAPGSMVEPIPSSIGSVLPGWSSGVVRVGESTPWPTFRPARSPRAHRVRTGRIDHSAVLPAPPPRRSRIASRVTS